MPKEKDISFVNSTGETINYKDAIELDEIQVMDTTALAMSSENDMPLMIFKLFDNDNLQKAVVGEDIGTLVSNDVKTVLADE